jgi:hypothetical protein
MLGARQVALPRFRNQRTGGFSVAGAALLALLRAINAVGLRARLR